MLREGMGYTDTHNFKRITVILASQSVIITNLNLNKRLLV